MIGLNYTSEYINTSSEYFKLSSIFSEDNLIFAISRLSDDRILSTFELSGLKEGYLSDEDYLYNLFQKNNLFAPNIVEVNFAYLTHEFSLVPNEIEVDKDAQSAALEAVSAKQYSDDYEVFFSLLPTINSKNYFPFPKVLHRFLKSKYKSVICRHANDSIIEKSKSFISEDNFVLANINNHRLQTVISVGGKIVQSNVYKIKSKEDVLYYLLLNLKNHGMPTNIANVYMSGRLSKDSDMHKLLYGYIKKLKYIDNIPRLRFANVFLGKPKHLFFDIFTLCEL